MQHKQHELFILTCGIILIIGWLYLVRRYVNKLDTECQCEVINHDLTKYMNIFVYATLALNVVYFIISVSNVSFKLSESSQALLLYLIYIIGIIYIITYVVLFKYILDIETDCSCKQVDPIVRKVVKTGLIIMFIGWGVLLLMTLLSFSVLLGVVAGSQHNYPILSNSSLKRKSSLKKKSS
jgi:hypothetical protein